MYLPEHLTFLLARLARLAEGVSVVASSGISSAFLLEEGAPTCLALWMQIAATSRESGDPGMSFAGVLELKLH